MVDVVNAREWSGHSTMGRTISLARWASLKLNDRYPSFRRKFFLEAIQEGRLILAIDGYDEVSPSSGESLADALIAHRSRLPLLLLQRTSSAHSDTPREPNAFRTPNQFWIQPISQDVVSSFLRRHVDWHDQLADSRNLAALTRILTNPLGLHIILKIWGHDKAPRALLHSDNPEETLWQRFVAHFVDESPLTVKWPTSPKYVRGLALCAFGGSAGYNVYDSLYHRFAYRLAVVGCGLVLFPIAYLRGTPSLGIVALVAIGYGLRDQRTGLLFSLSNKLRLREPPASFIALLSAFGAMYLIGRIVWGVSNDIFRLTVTKKDGSTVPFRTELTDLATLEAYWLQIGSETIQFAFTWTALAIGFLCSVAAESRLRDPKEDFLAMLPGVGFLSKRYPLILRIAIAIILIGDIFYRAPNVLWFAAAMGLAPVVYRISVVTPFMIYTKAPISQIRSLNRNLTSVYRLVPLYIEGIV